MFHLDKTDLSSYFPSFKNLQNITIAFLQLTRELFFLPPKKELNRRIGI